MGYISVTPNLAIFLHVTGIVQLSTVFITEICLDRIQYFMLRLLWAILFHFHICVLLLLLSVLGCSNAV